MPKYTTSYPSNKKPSFRRNAGQQLPSARRRAQHKRGAMYLRHSQGFSGGNRRRYRNRRETARRTYALIAVGCAFLVFAASVLWYANRSVTITLNGSETSVRINSSVQQLIDDQGLDLKSGNLLAVDDTVLKKSAGTTCTVHVNKKKVDVSALADTKLQGGETVKIGDGEDVYEEHRVQATEIKPTITVEGSGAIQYVQTWGVPGRSEVWTGATSGKTQDRGVVKEAQNAVVKARSVSPDSKKAKYVALTFDEGPSSGTAAILKVLEDKGVKATFFLQGDAVETNKSVVAQIAAAGHEVGSNSYSNKDLSTLSGDTLRNQLNQGFSAIAAAGGGTTALLRAPFASFSEQNWCDAMDLVSAVVGWNLDSGDWLLPGAQAVVNNVVSGVANGDIVLLTDNESTSAQTAEALSGVIDGLQGEGYTLVTLSELIATDKDLAKELASPLKVSMPKDAVLPTLASATAAAGDATSAAGDSAASAGTSANG